MTEFILSPDAPAVRDNVVSFIRGLSDSKKWRVKIVRYVRRRTLNQNSLFHVWVSVIALSEGNNNDEVKDALKNMFLPPRLVAMGDKLVEVRRSTAALNVEEMAEFMERVEQWAAGEGIRLPTKQNVLDDPEMFQRAA